MTPRDNTLRALRFEHPQSIPVAFHMTAACWRSYPQDALKQLMADHPLLFPDGPPEADPVEPKLQPWQKVGVRYRDSWGCAWETAEDGVTGAVVEHPLAESAEVDQLQPPDPAQHWGWGPIDWDHQHRRLAHAREHSRPAWPALRHGHTFLTLTYLRGYEALLMDMADEAPQLDPLVRKVTDFNAGLVERFLAAKPDILGYPEDLGMQHGPMLSVDGFRRYILPAYRELMAPARAANVVVHMHSDGDIRLLADDLIAAGVQVLNIQDRVNGIDWIAEHLRGRVAIDLDLDRQGLLQTSSPAEVEAWVDHVVQRLADPAGGLMLRYELCPGPGLDQVAAMMNALERTATVHGRS